MTDMARKQFQGSLSAVQDDIVRLAAMTLECIPRATEALLDDDIIAAQAVIDGDDPIDALALDIEERCTTLLALQQPMAIDLRAIMTAIKLNWELERSADLAVNIAKAVRRLHGFPLPHNIRGAIAKMSDEAARLTRLAIDAYVDRDAAIASKLENMDDRLDGLQVEMLRAMFDAHDSRGLGVQPSVQLALIGRYFERIGDHAVNMGERVVYLVRGAAA